MSENEIRAEAVREATRYLERIHKRGLRSRDDILADLDAVAFRMEQGMTARGNIRITQPSVQEPEHRGRGCEVTILRCGGGCGSELETSEPVNRRAVYLCPKCLRVEVGPPGGLE